MPRTYERKFDWDEAKRLHEDGMSYNAIAARFGVSQTAIWRVVTPGAREKSNARIAAWQKTGVCSDCGGKATRRHAQADSLCMKCSARRSRTSVRDDALWCSGCQQWKPDDDFPKDRAEAHRRDRHVYCRPCNTRTRREWRHRNPEKEKAYQREYYQRVRKHKR